MNKQRQIYRPEVQVCHINRPTTHVPQHRIEPFHQVVGALPTPSIKINYHNHNQQQPIAHQKVVVSARTGVRTYKENVAVLGPVPQLQQGHQVTRIYTGHVKQAKNQNSQPQLAPTKQLQHNQQQSQPKREPMEMFRGDRDRVLTDIGNNMFNSAIYPSLKNNEEILKNRWAHNTPDILPATKFNQLQMFTSSSFDVLSEDRDSDSNHSNPSQGKQQEDVELFFRTSMEAPSLEQIKVEKSSQVSGSHHFIRRERASEELHVNRMQKQPRMSQKSNISQHTSIHNPQPEVSNRFKQLDQLARKIKNVEKAVEQFSSMKLAKKESTAQTIVHFMTKSPSTNSASTGKQSNKIKHPPTTQELLEDPMPITLKQNVSPIKMQFHKSASMNFQPRDVKTSPYFGHPLPYSSRESKPQNQEFLQNNGNTLFKKKQSNYQTEGPILRNKKSFSQQQMLSSPRQIKDVPMVQSPVRQIFPQYTIPQPKLSDFYRGKFLGKGKFGQVYTVVHKSTGFVCALKVISKKTIRQDKLQTQMIRQLKILSYVNHPNVINCYGFFSDSQNVYVLLELCTGGHLFKQIQQRKRLPQKETADIIRQVAQGVKYLHGVQILHRDIKPQNIILQNGVAKICDFGWSVFSGGLRKTVCGTPLYLSPQILKGEQYDQKIDLWAIGILTYQLIVGRIPFRIWNESQLNKIVSEDVTFPQYLEISQEARNFILRILQKDPSQRLSIDQLFAHPFLKRALYQPNPHNFRV